jgi:hypothetical protein
MHPDDEDLIRFISLQNEADDPIRFIRPHNEADIEALISKSHRGLKVVAIRILLGAMPFGTAEVEADDVLQEVYMDVWRKGIESVKGSLTGFRGSTHASS